MPQNVTNPPKNLITLAQTNFCKIENQGNLFIVSFREQSVSAGIYITARKEISSL
jgi:hypothetical protein